MNACAHEFQRSRPRMATSFQAVVEDVEICAKCGAERVTIQAITASGQPFRFIREWPIAHGGTEAS